MTSFISLLLFAIPVTFILGLADTLKPSSAMSSVECPLVTTMAEAITDYELTHPLGLIQCYCNADFSTTLYEKFTMSTGTETELCYNLFYDSIIALGLSTIMSGALATISFVFDKLLTYLSYFEKHIDKNQETASRIIKLFTWKYFNSG